MGKETIQNLYTVVKSMQRISEYIMDRSERNEQFKAKVEAFER